MDRQEIEEIADETGEKHSGMSSEMDGNHKMAGVEHPA
jgi:hypothetical protein